MAYLGRVKPTETTSSVLRSTYTGNGSTTTYALPGPVANETSIIATINGVTQQDAAYSTDGSNIIFVAAPASGDEIEIRTLSAVAMSYAPSAGSVVTGVIADGAVTTAKINDASVTGAKLGTGAAVANIGSRAITAGQMPAGTVLQVVQAYTNSGFTNTTSSSYVATTLSGSITPFYASSKILVSFTGGVYNSSPSGNSLYAIFRNGSNIANNQVFSAIVGAWSTQTGSFLDVPATTSAITYQVYMKAATGGTTYFGGDSPLVNTITMMEIAV